MKRLAPILTLAICAAMLLAGCSKAGESANGSADIVGEPRMPAHVDRSTPEAAVRAYLDGITYTYRMANSSAASDTMTPYEYVRVDAYVELNRQEGRALEQTLTAFEVRSNVGEEPTMTVIAYEEWAYRYFSVDDMRYTSDEATAAYDSSYTVVKQPDALWLVDEVDVTMLGEVE